MARFLILLMLFTGCTKPVPVPKDDEPKIRLIIDADKKLDRALKEADDEAAKGNDAHAAELLDTKAVAAADDAIHVAEAQAPVTQWGMDQKSALLSILHERRDVIPEYAKSLRSDDLEVKLGGVQKQADVEKRTMDVVLKASQTP